MDLAKFDTFNKECSENLAGAIDEILRQGQEQKKIFTKNHYKREDILFFATMSDGDYIEEMLNVSVKMFNSPETAKA